MANDITVHNDIWVEDAQEIRKLVEENIHQFLNTIKERKGLSDFKYHDDGSVSYTPAIPLEMVKIMPWPEKPADTMKDRLTTMYDGLFAGHAPDPYQDILNEMRVVLERHRHKPVNEDNIITLMEEFGRSVVKHHHPHGRDVAVTIHAVDFGKE